MTNAPNKRFSRLVTALCFCLCFSNIANVSAMYAHSMAADHDQSVGVNAVNIDVAAGEDVTSNGNLVVEPHSTGHAHHKNDGTKHNAHQPAALTSHDSHSHDSFSHNCCDNPDSACSSSSAACSIHCSMFVNEINHQVRPVMLASQSLAEPRLTNPLPVNLEAPFKPPRS